MSTLQPICDFFAFQGEDGKVDPVPQKVTLPKNLFIIGTINVDETTYMFSPKVLDRANVIEFKIAEKEMAEFLKGMKEIDRESINGKAAGMGASFVQIASSKELAKNTEAVSTLQKFFKMQKYWMLPLCRSCCPNCMDLVRSLSQYLASYGNSVSPVQVKT